MKTSAPESTTTRRLTAAARVACAGIIAIGCVIFIGWLLNVQVLFRLHPVGKPMNPLSALMFVAASYALWRRIDPEADTTELRPVSNSRPRRFDVIAQSLGVIVALAGALKLADCFFHLGLRIDYALFPKTIGLHSSTPNRMALTTALNFFLCGLALTFFDVETRRGFRPAQALVLVAGVITLISLVGYSYGAPTLYRVGGTVPMALNSAILFALFIPAFLAASPGRGLMTVVTSPRSGGTVARQLLPVAIFIPWILGALLLQGVKQHYYEREMAVSSFAVLSTIIFTALIWWNAKLLYLTDLQRAGAERRLTAQHNCARILASSPNWAEAAPRVLEAIGQALGWDIGAFWRTDATSNSALCSATWTATPAIRNEFLELSRKTALARGLGLPGRVWSPGLPVWISDVTKDDNFPRREAAASEGLHTAVAFPVQLGGEFFGVIEFLKKEIEPPDETLLELLAGLGGQIGQFIERTRAEEQLRQAGANLARSNTDLEQFAYVASHDLFEPLRMVISYLELLSDRYKDRLDAQAREFIGFAADGAQRMQALIQDLLEYSRLETRGRVFEPVDCQQILQAARSNLKVALEETAATLIVGPLPKVLGDEVQLTQVFQNLVGNAVKFHGAEPPRIEVQAERREREWVFSVRDNGIGIDPANFDRIFIIFQRLHTRREYSGTGMGLAIVKKIVERHGGRIWVESAPGKGSTFLFTLPALREG